MTTCTVSETRIRLGQKALCSECPVALSILEVLRDGLTATVTNVYLTVEKEGVHELDIRLPTSARMFILRFDNDQPVEPFTFDIDIPERLLRSTE